MTLEKRTHMVLTNIINTGRRRHSKSSLKNQSKASTGKIVDMTSKNISLRIKENERARSKTEDMKEHGGSIELQDRLGTLRNDINIPFVPRSRKLAVRVCRSAKIDDLLGNTKEIDVDSKNPITPKSSLDAKILKTNNQGNTRNINLNKEETTIQVNNIQNREKPSIVQTRKLAIKILRLSAIDEVNSIKKVSKVDSKNQLYPVPSCFGHNAELPHNIGFEQTNVTSSKDDNTGRRRLKNMFSSKSENCTLKRIKQSANHTGDIYPECKRKVIARSASTKVTTSNVDHSNENIKVDKGNRNKGNEKKQKDAVEKTRNAIVSNEKEKTGEGRCVKDGSPSLRNLSKKTDFIESLLMSDKEDEEHTKQPVVKFFRARALLDKTDKTPEKQNEGATGDHFFTRPKNRLQRVEENNNTYEFISLSQNSPKTIDPAADVVKKLIDEGRAEVATHKKGSGKLVLKRIRQRKKINSKTNQPIIVNSAKNIQIKKNSKIVEPLGGNVVPKESINNDISELNGLDDGCNDFNESMSSFNPIPGHVLLNQIIRNGPKRDYVKQRKLLDVVRNYISTPLNKTMASSSTPQHFSPNNQNNSGNASPWRVHDNLPQAFYFTGNSSNLPSFSSDYIPSTPRKQRVRFEETPNIEKSLSSPINTKESTSDERLRPPLTHGSPLKPVNVISVEVLPPWRPMDSRENVEEVSPERTIKEKETNSLIRVEAGSNLKSDIFGFEEYLRENDENFNSDTENIPTTNTKSKLKSKRLKLKKLKDAIECTKKTMHKPIKAVFDEGGDQPRQLKIMDMLCSTMIDSHRCSGIIAEEQDQRNLEKTPALFEEPESHFDKNNYSRNYTRQKRRKLRHCFSIFENSDDSEDEEDRSSVKTPLKRPKKIDEQNVELETFIKEFNAMVTDVEQYELPIE